MEKRVALNISLPDQAFKDEVERISRRLNTTPSKEFVKLYKRLAKRDLSTNDKA